jgi:hypothetical protein
MQCPKCKYIRTPKDCNPDWQCPSCHISYAKYKNQIESWGKFKPNFIPAGTRYFHIIASLLLLAYGTHGIYVNDLVIPGRRGRSDHLQDEAALIMYAAFICACIVMISVVIDHYDKRDNEHKYQAAGRLFKYLGWGLFVFALLTKCARGS